jgi:transcriptional regulator with XRE-family HTH domain
VLVFSDRLRQLRKDKRLSQGDIEKRSGLLRCYISRIENGYTVPAIETLERLAWALEVPLYRLFYDGKEPPSLPNHLTRKISENNAWGASGKNKIYLHKLIRYLRKVSDADRKLLLALAQKTATEHSRKTKILE